MPLYKNCRLRTGRFSQRGGIYLLTAVVKHRTPLFRDFKLGRCVVAEMMNAQRWNQAQSLAWVVMPDHLHWLMQLEDASLETLMRQVKSRSSKAINERCARTGQLWQAGFHDRALRQEEDLLASARYIVANPLRAGLVKRVGDYPLWDAIWLQGYQASSSTPRPQERSVAAKRALQSLRHTAAPPSRPMTAPTAPSNPA